MILVVCAFALAALSWIAHYMAEGVLTAEAGTVLVALSKIPT
jgi:hypothetical protein